jgi:predicted acylesterase/phospholipase RssA
MSDPNTLRILELDGGGERGYLSLSFFQKFIQLWGINPATLASQFDIICGTSIGGIMALGFAFGLTPDQIMPFFTVQGPYIFSLTSLTPSVRPNLAAKIALITADIPFYQSSGPTAAQYGYGLLQATLESIFGSNTLQNLKTNVLIPSYQYDNSKYVLFSNLNYPDFIGQNELISNVALATSSAPIYFPALNLNNHVYIDGGVYNNNPAELGRTLAQIIKPTAVRTCILSLGTGLGELGFDPGNPSMIDPRIDPKLMTTLKSLQNNNVKLFDSIATIFSLFNIAAVGSQESTAKALYLESQYTLNQLYYYRFQPKLDLSLDTELDNTDPAILTYYQNTANQWYNNDIENITNFIGHLTA